MYFGDSHSGIYKTSQNIFTLSSKIPGSTVRTLKVGRCTMCSDFSVSLNKGRHDMECFVILKASSSYRLYLVTMFRHFGHMRKWQTRSFKKFKSDTERALGLTILEKSMKIICRKCLLKLTQKTLHTHELKRSVWKAGQKK